VNCIDPSVGEQLRFKQEEFRQAAINPTHPQLACQRWQLSGEYEQPSYPSLAQPYRTKD
jgi:hypothetical protein